MSVTTTVLVHCLAPSESSSHINGQSHLCEAGNAGDATWKTTVSPTTVSGTIEISVYGVTVSIGIIRAPFVKAQSQIS